MSWAEVKKINSDMDKPLDQLINEMAGIPPSNMIKFEAYGMGQVALLYIEGPGDTIIDGQTICTVAGVKIVRKETGYPDTENDGTIILDIPREDLSKYATEAYADEGLTYDKTYYYAAFPYSDHGVYNRNPKNRASAKIKEYECYGFNVAPNDSNPATRVSYKTGVGWSSKNDNDGWEPMTVNLTTGEYDLKNWKNAFFIRNARPVMLKYDGTVAYELDHNDQTKKLDGTPSDISNPDFEGNAMVEFPKMYIMRWSGDGEHHVRISNYKIHSGYKCYQHMNGTTELDHIYLPMFEGCRIGEGEVDGHAAGRLRSLADQTPEKYLHYNDELWLIYANGVGWVRDDWMNAQMVKDLLFLLGKTTDIQATFGYGHSFDNRDNSGPLLQTGTLKNKGMFYGGAARDGTNANVAVKFFWLENYYGDRWDRKDGVVYGTDGKIKVKPYPPYDYGDGSSYIDTGITISGSANSEGEIEGFISKTKMTEYGEFPIEVNGSYTTYQPDASFSDTKALNFLYWGGDLVGYYGNGAAFNVEHDVNMSGESYGTSLTYKWVSKEGDEA